MTAPTLGERAARGAAVTLGAQVTRILLQTVSVAVLSRLVGQSAFGMVAMVAAIIGVGELLRDFGLSSAAIQSPTLTRQQRDNLFWINSAIGLCLAGVCFAGAGLVSMVYGGKPVLIPIAQALAVTFLLNGLATQYRAGLTRSMRFRALAVIDVAAPACALAVAIAVAMTGHGVWALVWQQITMASVGLVLAMLWARWLPGRPRRGVPMRSFMRFGTSLLVSQLIGYVANNMDTFLIGRQLGSVQTGYYTRAFSVLMTPLGQVRAPSTTVALPALSRVRDDQRRFDQYVIAGQLALSMPLAVVLGVVIGAAEPVVRVFLGAGWEPSIPVLQWLAVAGLFQTMAFVGYWIYLARGLTRSLMHYSLVSAAIRIACIVIGINWGITGVAIGFAVAPMLAWPISLWWLSNVTVVPSRALYGGAGRLIALGALVAAAAWTVSTSTAALPAIVRLILATLAGLAVTALLAVLVRPVRRDVQQILTIVRLALPDRFQRGKSGSATAASGPATGTEGDKPTQTATPADAAGDSSPADDLPDPTRKETL